MARAPPAGLLRTVNNPQAKAHCSATRSGDLSTKKGESVETDESPERGDLIIGSAVTSAEHCNVSADVLVVELVLVVNLVNLPDRRWCGWSHTLDPGRKGHRCFVSQ